MSETAISVKDLSYQGKDGVYLKELSFSITKKGIHGILSPLGVDASLLLDLLAGVRKPSSATVAIDACEIDISSALWKKKIGYVPKAPAFYANMTVYELLDFVGEARGVSEDLRLRQIEEALELVGLHSLAMRLIDRLSEGEKKRVSLAAALLGNPSVLLLDDPSAELFDLILMLGKHKTVLLGSGDFAMMKELCEDVVILADGMLLASGNFADLEEALVKNSEMESLSALYDSIVEISRRKEPKKSSLWSGEERER